MIDKKTKEAFKKRKKEIDENEWDFHGFPKVASAKPEEIKRIKLFNLHDKYKELLYIEDINRIDVVLAVALSRKLKGIPLWMILVGPSGDMKSVQLNALEDSNAFVLHNLTSKTLVNGYKDKEKHPDLAPELHEKLILIYDMAQLLKLPPVEKGELWGQLRDLYDGFAGKVSGMGSNSRYEGLKTTLLAGSTPAIDAQILVHQDLGTRELIYRTKGSKNKEKVMKKCFENEEMEKEITEELKLITTTFLRQTEVKRDYIPKKITKEIMRISKYITIMRATAEFDQYSNELRNIVYPEEPTRIAKQLKRLYICLMSLAEDYPEATAMDILREVARSSSFPLRIRIFEFLMAQNQELTTSKIAEMNSIGKSTTKRELSVFWSLGIINCRKESTSFPDKFIDYWSVNKEHSFIKAVHRYNT